jgi:hypothetical protein
MARQKLGGALRVLEEGWRDRYKDLDTSGYVTAREREQISGMVHELLDPERMDEAELERLTRMNEERLAELENRVHLAIRAKAD